MQDFFSVYDDWNRTFLAQADVSKSFAEGINTYSNEFLRPLLTAAQLFRSEASE